LMDSDLVCFRAKSHRCCIRVFRYQVFCSSRKPRSGVPHGPSVMASTADFHNIGVAKDDVDCFDRYGDQVRNYLRKTSLMALAGRLSADDDVDMTIETNLESSLLRWRADR